MANSGLYYGGASAWAWVPPVCGMAPSGVSIWPHLTAALVTDLYKRAGASRWRYLVLRVSRLAVAPFYRTLVDRAWCQGGSHGGSLPAVRVRKAVDGLADGSGTLLYRARYRLRPSVVA